jgi:hypothetical protein
MMHHHNKFCRKFSHGKLELTCHKQYHAICSTLVSHTDKE